MSNWNAEKKRVQKSLAKKWAQTRRELNKIKGKTSQIIGNATTVKRELPQWPATFRDIQLIEAESQLLVIWATFRRTMILLDSVSQNEWMEHTQECAIKSFPYDFEQPATCTSCLPICHSLRSEDLKENASTRSHRMKTLWKDKEADQYSSEITDLKGFRVKLEDEILPLFQRLGSLLQKFILISYPVFESTKFLPWMPYLRRMLMFYPIELRCSQRLEPSTRAKRFMTDYTLRNELSRKTSVEDFPRYTFLLEHAGDYDTDPGKIKLWLYFAISTCIERRHDPLPLLYNAIRSSWKYHHNYSSLTKAVIFCQTLFVHTLIVRQKLFDLAHNWNRLFCVSFSYTKQFAPELQSSLAVCKLCQLSVCPTQEDLINLETTLTEFHKDAPHRLEIVRKLSLIRLLLGTIVRTKSDPCANNDPVFATQSSFYIQRCIAITKFGYALHFGTDLVMVCIGAMAAVVNAASSDSEYSSIETAIAKEWWRLAKCLTNCCSESVVRTRFSGRVGASNISRFIQLTQTPELSISDLLISVVTMMNILFLWRLLLSEANSCRSADLFTDFELKAIGIGLKPAFRTQPMFLIDQEILSWVSLTLTILTGQDHTLKLKTAGQGFEFFPLSERFGLDVSIKCPVDFSILNEGSGQDERKPQRKWAGATSKRFGVTITEMKTLSPFVILEDLSSASFQESTNTRRKILWIFEFLVTVVQSLRRVEEANEVSRIALQFLEKLLKTTEEPHVLVVLNNINSLCSLYGNELLDAERHVNEALKTEPFEPRSRELLARIGIASKRSNLVEDLRGPLQIYWDIVDWLLNKREGSRTLTAKVTLGLMYSTIQHFLHIKI